MALDGAGNVAVSKTEVIGEEPVGEFESHSASLIESCQRGNGAVR